MKLNSLLLPLLAAPVLLAAVAHRDAVTFAPAADAVVTKAFTTDIELALDEMRMVMNGEETDVGAAGIEMTLHTATRTEVTDVYGKLDGGRPLRLARTFNDLANTTSVSTDSVQGSEDMVVESVSDLEGVEVIFTWDAEADAYVASYADEEETAAPELLDGLDEDMDLRGLLPAGEVAEGDTWEVDVDYFAQLLGPGGDLGMKPEDPDAPVDDPNASLSLAEMLGDIEGKVVCEYLGVREEEGRRLAEVRLTVEISSVNDITEAMGAGAGSELEQQGVAMEFHSADVELLFEGEGLLRWDLAGGHFASFELTGDLQQVMEMSMTMSMGTRSMELEQTVEMSGTLATSFEATAE